jgi:endonuclease YncB( thermonuclease family)
MEDFRAADRSARERRLGLWADAGVRPGLAADLEAIPFNGA